MTSDELDALGRQRRDADVRYNAALTALDQAVVAASRLSSVDRDHRELVATALMEFLQQITAFVETKDRELAAASETRSDQIAREIQSLDELRTQVGVLQRAIEMLKRSATAAPTAVLNPPAPVTSARSQIPSPQVDDYKYVGFEDAFRGADAVIEERLRAYVPVFAGRSSVLDIGCGRGEMLSALKDAGVTARGIDTNAEMVAVARERGLEATGADALGYVSSLPDESLGGIIATQVIEHLEPSYLMRLLDAAAQKLQPGAPIVLETINPACWLAFFSSYIRDFTHVRPVHPETLQYLLRASGFARVEIRYSAPVPDHMKMKTVDLPAEVLASSEPRSKAMAQIAHTVNANAVILNNLLFTHLDYAAIGYRS
jgi:2-polyprenyl-3-methyl-5-hydroxy-6-metoxy-1,4-benzoquinol methylase